MTDTMQKLAHQLTLIRTSVQAASELVTKELLATEEQLFEAHLATVLSEQPPPVPMYAYDLNRHLKKWININYGYTPGYREIAAGLKALGWSKLRVSGGMRWMPPSDPAPSAHWPPAAEPHQDPKLRGERQQQEPPA